MYFTVIVPISGASCYPEFTIKTKPMSGMEEETRNFLQRIVWTISLIFLWLMINIAVGIYNGWMIPSHGMRTGNYIFYLWMLLSLYFLVRFIIKIWRHKFPHG